MRKGEWDIVACALFIPDGWEEVEEESTEEVLIFRKTDILC